MRWVKVMWNVWEEGVAFKKVVRVGLWGRDKTGKNHSLVGRMFRKPPILCLPIPISHSFYSVPKYYYYFNLLISYESIPLF